MSYFVTTVSKEKASGLAYVLQVFWTFLSGGPKFALDHPMEKKETLLTIRLKAKLCLSLDEHIHVQ